MSRTVIAHAQVEIVEENGKLYVEATDHFGPLPPLLPEINGPSLKEELSLGSAIALIGDVKDLVGKLLSAGKKQ